MVGLIGLERHIRGEVGGLGELQRGHGGRKRARKWHVSGARYCVWV